MLSRLRWFNTYLCLVLVAATSACRSGFQVKDPSTLRLHLQAPDDGTDRVMSVPIYRANPYLVTVEKSPFLTEAYVKEASVVDTMGGFSIRIAFEQLGTFSLNQYSTANPGRYVAIYSQFAEEARWLGAPRFTKPIADGVLVFTPDATREEAERIVLGLNNVAAKIRSQEFFH